MSNEVELQMVGKDGTFSFQGEKYGVAGEGMVGKYVFVLYDPLSGKVQKNVPAFMGESSGHLARMKEE